VGVIATAAAKTTTTTTTTETTTTTTTTGVGYTVRYATRKMLQRTNAIMNSFYHQNQDATTNAKEYYRPT
jgi:hypothetical protein